MKKRGRIWFFIVALVILFISITTFTGVDSRYGDVVTQVVRPASDIRFGIDIRGGVEVSFVPAIDVEPSEAQMDAAQAVIEQRLLSLGISDYELYKDVSQGRVILRFPWQADETEFDPQTTIQELSVAAVLTFREGGETDASTGQPTGVTAETIILEGDDIAEAQSQYGPIDASGTNEHHVLLTLTDEGTAKFAEATARIAESGGSISIWMDDTMISNPSVSTAINSETAIISGGFDPESSKLLADRINAGALPFALQAESYSTISPVLGEQSLQAMVLAGIAAIVLIVGFMIFSYRLPGVVASLAIIGQTAMTIALVSRYFAVFPSATLTLPGIAGIILAIGMGVDASVITAERIKEELYSGKKLDVALRSGFARGLPTIIDSNMTVLIVAMILMGAFGPTDGIFATILSPFFFWFGPSTAGTIYSFGYTLFFGVLLNFLFGVLANRVMLYSLSKFKSLKNPVLYGATKDGKAPPAEKPLAIVQNRKRRFVLSIVLVVGIVLASFGVGVDLDVQFSGGAMIRYGYTGEMSIEEIQTVVDEALGTETSIQVGDDGTGQKSMTIAMPGTETVAVETLDALDTALSENFSSSMFTQLEVNNVEPSMGQTFLMKCVLAVIIASALILLYIGIRFRRIGGWRGGLTAVVALVHDLIIVYGVYVVMGIPLSGNFIAAMLTILGYSINDTVVVYDRIRENRGLYGRSKTFAELVNLSINQSLKRSVKTTITTVISLGCVCIFSVVYGLDSIFTFAFPLMIGMFSGVYSTICIAGPLWVSWEEKIAKTAKKELKEKKSEPKSESKKEEPKKEEIKAENKDAEKEQNSDD